MVGVDEGRVGGMWTVAENYISNKWFNQKVKLYYIATSTGGSKIKRIKKMLEGYLKILICLTTIEIDIVHIHMAEKGSVYRKGVIIRLAKLFGKKVVVQMHAGPILSWYDNLSPNKKKIVKKIFDSSDRMLVLGDYWKKQIATIIENEKIDVLYNGSECPIDNPYNVEGKDILYLGLLKKTKGTYDLVDAIKLIDDVLPEDIKVYLCGVDETGEMMQYVVNQGLQNRIELPGWIDKNTRLELFKNTQMCVLPSYFEALSMTVIESMCYGIPMVTTNISTMPELLGDEIDLVEPGDIQGLSKLILKYTRNKEIRLKVSNIEYSRAKSKFDVNAIMKRTVNIYNGIL